MQATCQAMADFIASLSPIQALMPQPQLCICWAVNNSLGGKLAATAVIVFQPASKLASIMLMLGQCCTGTNTGVWMEP